MSHTDIIIIIGTLFISSTVGVYVVVKYINLHTRPPINSLIRSSRDIELQDYIEPSRSLELQGQQDHSYNTLDLLQPQQVHIAERVPTYVPSYPSTDPFSITNGVTSYPSTEPFSFTNSCDSLNLQTFPEYYIQCCLEDSINLKYSLIILFIIFTMVNYCWIHYHSNKK
jgi:hypothetical protein